MNFPRLHIDEIVGKKNITKEVIDFLSQLQDLTYTIKPTIKAYAGVGSRIERVQAYERENNVSIELKAREISYNLARAGFIMRSGGATGMDSIFEYGADALGIPSLKDVYKVKDAEKFNKANDGLLYEICRVFHPAPHFLEENGYPIKLLSRNLFQVLGSDWEVSTNPDNLKRIAENIISFGVIFTPDGCVHHTQRTQSTGGTGQFISYATFFGVQVHNLANPTTRKGFDL